MNVYRGYTADQLDRQYGARAAVPEHPQIFRDWLQRSRLVRARADCCLDLRYGPHERERLDLFLAPMPGAPLLLFFHGGYWQAMDKDHFSFIAEHLTGAGLNLAVASYPLCPAARLADIALSARRCAAWLWRHAADYGAGSGPGSLRVCGHSAGAQLTALLFATSWPDLDPSLPAGLVSGGVAISGIYDLEPLRHTRLNEALGLDSVEARRNSPLFMRARTRAPLLVAVGARESEEFRRQCRALADTWNEAGADVEAAVLPRCHHFNVLEQLASPDGFLYRRVLEEGGG